MSLGPLLDYMNALNGGYGFAIAALPTILFVLQVIPWRTDEPPNILKALVLTATVAVQLLLGGLLFFILYKSYNGVRYEFWPLTFSILIGLLAFTSTAVLQMRVDGEIRDLRPPLIIFFILCVMMSPAFVGMLRLTENFHPLWP